ncbi:hypothetical protein [Bordetella genomosp. 9]|uniref:hypothetical protein n=1 Tax=Bordetella genomosp. 9 TaxID=1416803 RepID=UPI0012F96B7A|nr:hypothetical protein [Bordetella genomosp. 9]
MRRAKRHIPLSVVLGIALAAALTLAPWAVSGVQAADQRSSSGGSRPVMPGNQPAGTGLTQQTPGSAPGQQPQQPGKSSPGMDQPGTAAPSSGPSSMPAQGTVQGSKGAPASQGDPAGGTAGSRGQKDTRRGH